ncbi:PBP1A family penicillin-binding protein [Enterococcus faecium]|uniref:PBP1A family penicillin-binding protein n=2 Tax=Enterococcus faecium TaxID=1352 RepID=UPI000FDBD8A2|nr:PBP1A family penicillin-binding protein [Enterococcus faecium]HAQ1374713.1 PBP1A family penicillin-binding protein [Enterococcus faecium Ef_aus0080]HAQ1377579.1 PBP1A family penicillin-binding protein [Enterococcus faecium Ef_aus0084]KAB7525827.1 PBP1A family penicillin-binding protein [Enterococcus faecium]NTL58264.1 PBP1A family penicillin-binding protein [Enterococcus faecium]TKL28153.1 PBP1A family penicillin-binding protein [Enterococcus faecium]
MANEQTRSSRRQKQPTPKKSVKKNSGKGSGKSSGTHKKGLFIKILLGILSFFCILFLAGVGLFWYYAKDAPELTDKKLDATVSSKLYTQDGELFEDLGAEKREKISANELPKTLEDAIVSVEDRRFYKHIGVDPIRIIGSALSNFTSGGLQGGSTLTQQLIKLSFFSTSAEDQTLKRKAQEAWMAVRLEQKKSKQEILTYYVNKVYMSNGLYGMETASEMYFGKKLSELSLPQTALLAGMPQAPSAYDPYVYPDQAKKRRDTVLYTMLQNEKISQTEYDQAVNVPVTDGLQELTQSDDNTKIVDNYVKEVINEVQEKTDKNVYTDGLEIYTNLDLDAQKKLYDIVNTDQYVSYPDDEMQVASTLIDTNTGKVKAQIGGRHIAEDVTLGNNLAVNTSRDFGSTMKPVTDYGPAFEYLKYSTGKTITDAPYNYEGTSTPVGNWDNQYIGTITLRQALYLSRNVPAVKLFNEVGSDKVASFLKNLGIEYSTIHQSNAISSNTEEQDGTKYGASSLKMAAAYAAFANGGTYYKPQYVNKIVFQDGTEETYEPDGKTAMSPETAYMITDILKDTITEGTGTNAQIAGLYQAGKTGTSNYTDDEYAKLGISSGVYPDILFAGYTPNYSISVWTGYNKKMTPVTSESSHVASDVYRELMQYVSANVTNTDWEMPSGLIRVGGELYYKDQYTARSNAITPSTTIPSSSYVQTPGSSTTETTTQSSSSTSQSESTAESSKESTTAETSEPASSTTVPSSSSEESSTPSSSAPPASSSEPATSGADAANDHTPSSSTSASGNR